MSVPNIMKLTTVYLWGPSEFMCSNLNPWFISFIVVFRSVSMRLDDCWSLDIWSLNSVSSEALTEVFQSK